MGVRCGARFTLGFGQLGGLLLDVTHELLDLLGALNQRHGKTVVMVTHELASIFAIGDNSILLDAKAKTAIARGDPHELLEHCDDQRVQQFLRRGDAKGAPEDPPGDGPGPEQRTEATADG